jgi:hypothetical protein
VRAAQAATSRHLREHAMDWHCISFTHGNLHDGAAADCVLALESAYGNAGEPPEAEVWLSRRSSDHYAFYLSPDAGTMAPGVLQRFRAVQCEAPADLHRCSQMVL